MEIILIVLLIGIFAYLKPPENARFHEDYMDPSATRTIQGVFVVLVFIRHFMQYASYDGYMEKIIRYPNGYLAQLIVVPFLFYTGYGTMASIRHKGRDYVKRIPYDKFLKLLLRFDCCLLLFLSYSIWAGKNYDTGRILLSFTTWRSIGNSNWYVALILVFYIAVYLSFRWIRSPRISVLLVTALLLGYMFLIKDVKNGYWYNTLLVLPLGMGFCLVKERVDAWLARRAFAYPVAVCVLSMAVVGLQPFSKAYVWAYLLWGCAFALLMVLATMKLRLRNAFFDFLGSHVFSLYILQRIPMLVMKQLNIGTGKAFNYFVATFAATIIMALTFDTCWNWLEVRWQRWHAKKQPSL